MKLFVLTFLIICDIIVNKMWDCVEIYSTLSRDKKSLNIYASFIHVFAYFECEVY